MESHGFGAQLYSGSAAIEIVAKTLRIRQLFSHGDAPK
jgi:hypothetical protein